MHFNNAEKEKSKTSVRMFYWQKPLGKGRYNVMLKKTERVEFKTTRERRVRMEQRAKECKLN